jgi:hypothetical protein
MAYFMRCSLLRQRIALSRERRQRKSGGNPGYRILVALSASSLDSVPALSATARPDTAGTDVVRPELTPGSTGGRWEGRFFDPGKAPFATGAPPEVRTRHPSRHADLAGSAGGLVNPINFLWSGSFEKQPRFPQFNHNMVRCPCVLFYMWCSVSKMTAGRGHDVGVSRERLNEEWEQLKKTPSAISKPTRERDQPNSLTAHPRRVHR